MTSLHRYCKTHFRQTLVILFFVSLKIFLIHTNNCLRLCTPNTVNFIIFPISLLKLCLYLTIVRVRNRISSIFVSTSIAFSGRWMPRGALYFGMKQLGLSTSKCILQLHLSTATK